MVAAQAEQEIPGLVEAALGPAVLAILHDARGVKAPRRAVRYGPSAAAIAPALGMSAIATPPATVLAPSLSRASGCPR